MPLVLHALKFFYDIDYSSNYLFNFLFANNTYVINQIRYKTEIQMNFCGKNPDYTLCIFLSRTSHSYPYHSRIVLSIDLDREHLFGKGKIG